MYRSLFAAPLALFCVSCGSVVQRADIRSPQLPLRSDAEPSGRALEIDEDSAQEAIDFYLLKRTGGAPLPAEKLIEAQRHARTMPLYSIANRRFVTESSKSPVRDAALGTWQPLGPGNVGGRTRSLVIRPDDPNTMYAGSVGGGVWKTTDGGASWNPLTDLLPSIGIASLAMDPKNPDTLYAGTGEYFTSSDRGDSIRGAGIFKTTDGGNTWKQLSFTATSSFYYVHKLVISPHDSRRVYAATYGGVWLSSDAGDTWRRVLDRTGDLYGCQDLVIRTDRTTDYLFAACASSNATNPAIYRNVDAAGQGQWQIVFNPANLSRTALALAPSNQSIVYALASSSEKGDFHDGLLGVFRSTGDGDPGSWEMRTSNKDPNRLNTLLLTNPLGAYADVCSNGTKSMNNQGDYDISLAVDPLNPEIVWAGGIDVFRSDDGGKNWGIAAFWQISAPKLVHADVHVLAFSPFYNGGDNQTLFAATDGGMYRTDNALAATAKGDRAGCSPYATSVAWTNINGGYAVTQFYHGAIYPGGGAYIAGAQDNGTVRGSDASGPLDWRTAMGGDGGFVAIDPKDPNVWYAETTELSLRRTANGGNSFSTAIRGITEPGANFQFIAPFVMDPSESKRLYIGGRTLWRTTDGAQNWSEASAAIPASSGRISAIAVAPGDPNYMVFGTELGFIFRSDAALSAEKTTTWQSAQPRSGYLSHLAFDPINPEIVYATYSRFKSSAAQSHVYRSTDGGATWTGIDGSGQTGLPDVPVFSIIADPRNPTNLYLGTDIGVFVSLDSGATWSRDDNPFATAVTETLVLDRSAGQSTLFAFTHGRGVWKVTLPGSGDACQYAVSTDSITMPAFGVPVSVDVATGDNCTWSVFSRDNSFAMASPATGQGNGKFTINPGFLNNTTEPSVSKILVQDKPIAITQKAALVAAGNDDATSPFAIGDLPAVVIEDNSDATESDKDPVHSCTKSADSKTLWFSLKAPTAGSMRLSYQIRRTDNGADAGAVISLYRVVNGAMGPEFGCFVAPQTASGAALRTVTWTAREGDSYLVQLSATTSGAQDGAPLRTGKVTLAATLAQQ